jgi:hypothetical protein
MTLRLVRRADRLPGRSSRVAGMRIKPQLDHAVIVLVGRFNPAIFQPAWFALHEMMGRKEAETAHIKVIFGELSKFKVDQFRFRFCPSDSASPASTHTPSTSRIL